MTITDRKKDVIFVGGFNVYPAEVERILGGHPAVDSIAVIGAADPRLGEVPVAFVVPRAGSDLTADELTNWAREHIANFKVPRRVVVVDALPRNASMKVLKNRLRERLAEDGPSAAGPIEQAMSSGPPGEAGRAKAPRADAPLRRTWP